MTVIRKQTYLLPVYLFMFIASKLTNDYLVQRLGLLGASLSFLTVMSVYFSGSLLAYFVARKVERKSYAR